MEVCVIRTFLSYFVILLAALACLSGCEGKTEPLPLSSDTFGQTEGCSEPAESVWTSETEFLSEPVTESDSAEPPAVPMAPGIPPETEVSAAETDGTAAGMQDYVPVKPVPVVPVPVTPVPSGPVPEGQQTEEGPVVPDNPAAKPVTPPEPVLPTTGTTRGTADTALRRRAV